MADTYLYPFDYDKAAADDPGPYGDDLPDPVFDTDKAAADDVNDDENPYGGVYASAGDTAHEGGDAAHDPYSSFYGATADVDARIGEIDRELNSPYPQGNGVDVGKIVGGALDAAGKVAESVANAVGKDKEAERRAQLEREKLELERERLKLMYQGKETPYGVGFRWGMGGKRVGENWSPAGPAEQEQFQAGYEAGLRAQTSKDKEAERRAQLEREKLELERERERLKQDSAPQNTGIVPPHLNGGATPPVKEPSAADKVRAALRRQGVSVG